MNTTTTAPREATKSPSGYEIRPFEPGDRAAFLSLYESVFGHERSDRWFRWKFDANPFADHVPIVVAERDGSVVGCRAFFALEMRVDGEPHIAFQPCDTMVHSDHRRQGLFTAMNRLALERYRDGGPSFYFNFPNEKSRGGNVALGWQPVGTVSMNYRPQDPLAAAKRLLTDEERRGADRRGSAHREAARAVGRGARRVHRAHDGFLARSWPDLRVKRRETTPATTLEAVAGQSAPEGIHAARTARFYRWRLRNPAAEYVTYVARRGRTPVAALIVSPVDDHVRIVDAIPRAVGDHRRPLECLLEAVLEEYADRSYLTAFGETLPRPLRYRFFPDTQPPLSTVIRPTTRTLFAKSVDEELALEESQPADWTLSRLDLDTT